MSRLFVYLFLSACLFSGQAARAQFDRAQSGEAQPAENPFLGSWMARMRMQGGGDNVSFAEYAPNGDFRITSIIQGGPSNGMRMQIWGHYTVQKIGPSRYSVAIEPRGWAPRQFCVQGGACNQLPPLEPGTEIEDMHDANSFHSKAVMKGVTSEVEVHRSQIPQELMTNLNDTWMLPAPAPSPLSSGGTVPGGNYAPRPTYHVPGVNSCDDAQQNRICTVNSGHMYTDSRGCRMCAGPN